MKNFCPKKISTNKKYWHFCFKQSFKQRKTNLNSQPEVENNVGHHHRSSTSFLFQTFSFFTIFFPKKMAYHTQWQVKQVRCFRQKIMAGWIFDFLFSYCWPNQQSQLVRTNKQTNKQSKTRKPKWTLLLVTIVIWPKMKKEEKLDKNSIHCKWDLRTQTQINSSIWMNQITKNEKKKFQINQID